MVDLTHVVLASSDFPIEIAGWAVLLIGLLVTAFWTLYLYR
ncbi:hypothetical protein [Natronosalvus halobius]|nr:hypothetical protein [Natronosalvus halobius]